MTNSIGAAELSQSAAQMNGAYHVASEMQTKNLAGYYDNFNPLPGFSDGGYYPQQQNQISTLINTLTTLTQALLGVVTSLLERGDVNSSPITSTDPLLNPNIEKPVTETPPKKKRSTFGDKVGDFVDNFRALYKDGKSIFERVVTGFKDAFSDVVGELFGSSSKRTVDKAKD